MKKTYQVTTYDGKTTYQVTIDEDGVVDTDGLLPRGAENLRFQVERHISVHDLTAVQALQRAIGAYSHLTEVEDGPVADSL